MITPGKGKAQASATSPAIQALAEQLAAAAPPLTPDQLDALGQIIRSVPSAPNVTPSKKINATRNRHRQLRLPYDQVDTQPAGVVRHGRKATSSSGCVTRAALSDTDIRQHAEAKVTGGMR